MLTRVGGALALAVVLSSSPSRADAILDKPSFTASPKELLSLAAKASSTHAAVILREEEDAVIDAQNRRTFRFRRIFVVTTQAGVDGWGTFSWTWKPFHQDKPHVRARVIDPDGTVAELDPKLVTDAPEKSSPSVFSDRRKIEAPLPRLRIGSVIEEELVLKDRQPILPGGALAFSVIGADVPVQSTRITISTPARRGKLFTAGLPAKTAPKYAISGQRETWTYEVGPQAPFEEREGYVPRDVALPPLIGVSTSTWAILAREYRKLLDKRIADGPLTLPSGLPKTPSLDTIKAISSWLHRNVRYTGIEFDEASHIPWTPAETAKRGFGDCKDKATLLIALLRQAGITAELALLSTGPGQDVTPQLPGMLVFDHAIVRARLDGRDVWIDATEELLSPGQLPSRDQGRHALVISDTTQALVDTPHASPTDNVVRAVRTYELAEQDAAKRVSEVTTWTGVFGADQRDWIRGTNRDDVQKDLEEYAEQEHQGKLVRFSTTPPDDLARPFAMTLELTDVARAYTSRGNIDVYLFPTDTLARVPRVLTAVDKQHPRKQAFEWYRPHVFEIENRLVVPAGYTMPSAAADRIHQLGTARIVERQRVDGRQLVVTMRFESGKRRLTVAEVEAMQKAIEALDDAKTHVVIEHTGWSLAERGKFKAALAEIEKLIALHPKEAIHRTEMAYALLRAGMGEAARRAAREAVKLEPTNADAHVMLGWVLRHDTIGRDLVHDFDRAGAIAAYAKARKLDPKHVGAITGHAEVLQRDRTGALYGKSADLAAAADAWADASKADDTDEHALAHARVLLFARQFSKIEAVLANRTRSDMQDAVRVAAVAGSTGAGDAIAFAGRLRTGSAKSTLLATAAQVLVVLGNYAEGRALLAEASTAASRGAVGTVLQKMKRHDALPANDPRKPLEDVFELILDDSHRVRFFWDDQTAKEEASSRTENAPQLAAVKGFGKQFMTDMLHSVLETQITGQNPWRVEVEFLGNRGMYYSALDQKTAKLIGSAQHPQGVGRHIFRALARNDTATAKVLLEWLAKDLPSHPAIVDWNASAHDKQAMTLAAALLANQTDAARAIPALASCAAGTGERRARCDLHLASIYMEQNKWRELEQHALAWQARSADSPDPPWYRGSALTKLGRLDEAEKVLAAATARFADNVLLVFAQADVALERGAMDQALRHYERVAKLEPRANNEVAWTLVVMERDLDRGLELASKVVGADKDKAAPEPLNTLAVLEAELGRLDEARQDAWKSIENRHGVAPEDADWYVLGRIAEQLGLRDDAIAAYRKCVKTPSTNKRSIYALAKRRLQRMGVKL